MKKGASNPNPDPSRIDLRAGYEILSLRSTPPTVLAPKCGVRVVLCGAHNLVGIDAT